MAPEVDADTLTGSLPSAGEGSRHRDAARTRAHLLRAARRRFARDGYAATTVREIATDAGVNVALINRYFTSKEGLFAACLTSTATELDRPDAEHVGFDAMVRTLTEQILDSSPGERALQLLLLLRSSGDERADRIRLDSLRSIAERMAAVVGRHPGARGDDDLMLRVQVALATALGLVLLRSTAALQPLAGADVRSLEGPLHDAFAALLLNGAAPRPGGREGR